MRAAHAFGWTLRSRKRSGTPAHERRFLPGIRHFRGITSLLGAALVIALGVFAGTSYAYFTSSGSGTGHATAGTLEALTITATATPTSALVPGGTADLALQVTNPNGFSVTITALAAGSGTVTVSGGTGCTKTNAHVSVSAKTGLSTAISPGLNTVHIANGAAMGTTSFTGCQNASFSIPVKLTVKQ